MAVSAVDDFIMFFKIADRFIFPVNQTVQCAVSKRLLDQYRYLCF